MWVVWSGGKTRSRGSKALAWDIRCNRYSRITSTKYPSFCMTISSASTTSLTARLPPSMSAATTYADEHWHLHLSDCRNLLTYVHTNSRILPACDSLSSLTLPAPGAGHFVESILLHVMLKRFYHNKLVVFNVHYN